MSGFKTNLYQSTQLRQEMKINPRLYQAMELLYMPLLDLQQHLSQEMAENPFLELDEADTEEDIQLDEEGQDDPQDEIDWEEILLDGFDAGGRREQFEQKEYFQPTAVEVHDLHDFLDGQLRLASLDERAMRVGEEIIGNIDDDGSLSCSLENVVDGLNEWLHDIGGDALRLASEMEDEEARAVEMEQLSQLLEPYSVEEIEAVLEVVQAFDPPGVGARDLKESIEIQLRRKGAVDTLAYRIVCDHFEDLLNHRWTEVAKV
ncbi:MAG: hypothetical protein ACR2QM_07030, partial [Longimicrobiales bacterium]